MVSNDKPSYSVIDSIHYPEWVIKGWKIVFIFSERQLAEIKKLSRVSSWYEDPVIAETYIEKLRICFISIQKFDATFGVLPQVGDRLYDEETGMVVQHRSIDGNLMTITFTLSI